MIAKKDLVDQTVYSDGESLAYWDANEQAFYYWRLKMWGRFLHSDLHPDDVEHDDGDCFWPKEKIDIDIEEMKRRQGA